MKKMLSVIALLLYIAVANGQTGLTVSELLYQPVSGEAEYVELYNNSSQPVMLDGYHVVRWLGDTLDRHYELPPHVVGAHEYVVLTTSAASVVANYDVKYLDRVVECELPPYPNTGGSVVICTADGAVADRFDYSPSMHSRLLRNKAGVALERRSFQRPANDRGNWFSASSACGYGTPGYGNSQSTETLAEENSFVFSSTVVSPDGDDYQDVLVVEYDLSDGGLMGRAEVYDARGAKVRTLVGSFLLGTSGALVWDGLGDGDRALPPGHYVMQITLYGIEGTQQVVRRAVALR